MIDIEITRLIAAAVGAVLLGYALYVAAYVKHRNEIRDTINKMSLAAKNAGGEPETSLGQSVNLEKTSTWYIGYRLALVGLIVVSTAIGWALGWAVGQDHILSWVEDAALAAAGAVIGGFILDKYIIHPIADGEFFEKVEDPLVQRFLQDGGPVVEEVTKLSFREKRKLKKEAKLLENATPVEEAKVEEAPAKPEDPFAGMSFQQKVDLIEKLKRSL